MGITTDPPDENTSSGRDVGKSVLTPFFNPDDGINVKAFAELHAINEGTATQTDHRASSHEPKRIFTQLAARHATRRRPPPPPRNRLLVPDNRVPPRSATR